MQFMLMCCFDEKRWSAIPEQQRDTLMRDYEQWVHARVADGSYVTGGKLQESVHASTTRKVNGVARITDGPFAESKEQIGGYHVLECADRDAALALAQQIPTLDAGGVIELRPVQQLPRT